MFTVFEKVKIENIGDQINRLNRLDYLFFNSLVSKFPACWYYPFPFPQIQL